MNIDSLLIRRVASRGPIALVMSVSLALGALATGCGETETSIEVFAADPGVGESIAGLWRPTALAAA